MADAYREDLAYIHDAGFGHFATNAAPVLLEGLQRQGLDSGLVIDLGCGSGILAEAMSAAGYAVLGIDLSRAMVAMARRRVPNGRFREGSLLAAGMPPCVAVAAVGECFNYLFDSGNTEQGLTALFHRIYGALARGGLLVFDVAGPGRVPGPGARRSYTEGDGWAVLVTAEEDRRLGVLTRHITSFRRVGELYRRDEEVHRLRLLRRPEVVRELRGIGFRVRLLSGYGPFRFPPGHVGFLAWKPWRARHLPATGLAG
jgi:SAM-dependent methyltransferase